MEERITDLRLSDDDNRFIDEILEIISKKLAKANLAIQIKPVVDRFNKGPINGLVRSVVTDLECHLGLYRSNELDYKFKGATFTFEEGIERLIGVFSALKQNTDFLLPDPIYKLFQRWIIFENAKIEVEDLHADHWNYHLFKDVSNDDFYFSIMMNVSAGYWEQIFKVTEADKINLKTLVELNQTDVIHSMVDKLRNAYYSANLYR